MVSLILTGVRCPERYEISGSKVRPFSRAVFDVQVLSVCFLVVFFVCFLFFKSLGQYEAPSFSSLCILYSSSVHDIQLISEYCVSISLEIGSVLSSPHKLPIDILLSLLLVGHKVGAEAMALRFYD